MRHASRTPPPPDCGVCGLLQLMFFRKLINVAQSFEVSIRYYKFSKVICHFLRVFCIEFGA